jgi:hypothetical protein
LFLRCLLLAALCARTQARTSSKAPQASSPSGSHKPPRQRHKPPSSQLPLPPPRARDEAHSQRRARAFPAGSGLATATTARRLAGATLPACASLRPAPPLPASPLAYPASPLWSRPQAAGPREDRALAGSRWLRGQVVGYALRKSRGGGRNAVAYHAAPALPRASLRASGAVFWPHSPPEKRAAWPAPKPLVVIGGAPKKMAS